MRDFFGQTILLILGLVIELGVPLILSNDNQKRFVKILGILLILTAFIWLGFELGATQSRQDIGPIAQETNAETSEMNSTYSPYPTYTPHATYTPYPTYTKLPPTYTKLPSTDTPLPANTSPPPTPILRATLPPLPTVAIGGEYSVIQLETGLGFTTTLNYDEVDAGNDLLNYILRDRRSSIGVHQFLLRTNEILFRLMPLSTFKYAHKITDGKQIIMLDDGTEIEGQLTIILEDTSNEETFDLGTAKEVVLINLAETDKSMGPNERDQKELWQLEVLEPASFTYSVSDPRFVFQYSRISITGIYYDYETETQEFYLVDNDDVRHLANLANFDEIRFEIGEYNYTSQVTVKVGNTETSGSIIVTNKDLNEEGNLWFLVANLADSDALIAISNRDNPVMTLRKTSE